ncbi:DNRLRE domain-containing protein [Streptomyces sp. GSL17-111]|uniref:DNRLRE domain-containing protein n=1 Tax=Streptomyces sp. GSL17-111 TaxID=3121596 RepID=UPI0030F3814A
MPSSGPSDPPARARRPLHGLGTMAGTLVLALSVSLLPAFPAAALPPAATGGSGEVPEQRSGSAAGREHAVDASRTDANGANSASVEELPAGDDALPLAESAGAFTPVAPETEPQAVERQASERTVGEAGFDAERSKELPQRRDAVTKEYENPDGTRTTRVYPEPVHYQDDDGTWREIDPALVEADADTVPSPAARSLDGGGSADGVSDRLVMSADDSGLSFGRTGDDPRLAELAVGEGGRVAFGLADAAAVPGTVEGDTVRFPGIRPDADLTLQAEHGSVKETIVLNSPDAPRTWTFPLSLDGLTPTLDEDGSVELRDADGTPRAVVPTPWMEDSATDPDSGEPAISDAVSYRLEQRSGGRWDLLVVVDDAWLDAPEREYPVLVDPSVDDLETYGDAFVQDDWPDTNFGGDDELKVGSYDGGGSRANSYLRFDNVSSQLENRYILNADLGLFNHWSSSCSAHDVRVHQVKEAWQAGKVTWANQPPVVSTPVATASFAHGENCSGAAWRTIDLGLKGIDLVQDWVDGSTGNYGLSLRAPFNDSGAWKRFGSKNSANPPYLAITHSSWGAEYSVGSQTEPLTGHQGGEATVTVKNLGDLTWEALGWNEFRLGTRVRDHDSGELLDAVAFTRFNERVTPGDSATVDARIPHLPPGTYKINFDVQRLKDQKWMSSENVPVATVTVTSQDVGPRITDVYPRPGGQVGSLTPALFVDAETIDHYPADASIDHWFEVCEGSTEAPVNCVDSGWVDPRTWNVPADTLEWGEQYVWRVKAREGSEEGPLSPYYPFTTAVEQPAITSHLGGAAADGREVDPRTGNYTTTDTDAQVATVGPALSVTRTYNSRDPRDDNAFGAGWSTRYDMRVEPDEDGTGNVVVTYPSGRQVRFGHHPDGTYAPPHGSFATLTRTQDDGWRLTDKEQTDHLFDAQGRITEVTDFRGRAQSMTYDGDRLTTVTGVGDRTLNFTWSGDHVTSVTTAPPGPDSDPLTWDYTYVGHRLTEVCGPEDAEGSCTHYTYGDGSHHRTVVRDAGPFSYWRLGEEPGATEARSDLLLGGDEHAGTYHDVTLGTDGALAGSSDTAATFDGDSSYVQLPDQLVTDTPYLTVALWFRTTEDGVLFSYQNHTLEEDDAEKLTPALYVGTDGKLRGQFRNGDVDPITSTGSVADGAWHHAALTAAGNSQTLYLDGQPVGTAEGAISQHDQRFVYLGAGYWQDWPATTGTIGHFAGDIDEAAVHTRPLGARTIAEHHASGTDAQQLTRVTLPSGRTHAEVSYDTARDRVAAYTDADGGRYELSAHVLTGQDGRPATDGQDAVPEDPAVTVTVTDPDERTSSHTYDPLQGHRRVAQTDAAGNTATFAYDSGGFLAATTGPDGTVTRLGHDDRGNKISQTVCRDAGEEATCHTTHYAYFLNADDPLDPRNDQLVARRDARSADAEDDTYRTSYGYNSYGDRVSTTSPATPGFPDGRTETHTFTDGTEDAVGGGTVPAGLLATTTDVRGGETVRAYDAAGDLRRVTDSAGLVTEYTYDALGRELTVTETSEAHPDGVTSTTEYDGASRVVRGTGRVTTNAVTGDEHQAVTAYTHDADGNVLTETVSDTAGDAPDRVTERTYDGHGRLATVSGPEDFEESYTYDAYGNQTTRTMPGGVTFRYTYTARGELAETVLEDYEDGSGGDPADVVLDSYAYDPAGRLAEHTDAMGRTTRHTYYDDGLPAQEILTGYQDADGDTRDVVLSERHYDAAGHLTTEITGNGGTTTAYEIDAAGDTTAEVLDPDGLARRTDYTLDAGGSVATETRTGAGGDRTELITFERDTAGRLLREAVENDGADLVTTYEVDDRGLVLAETSPRGNVSGADPADHTTEFRYDAAGRLVETRGAPVTVEQRGEAPVTERPVTRSVYDAFGDETATRDANGEVVRTDYDALGRPVRTTLPDYTPPGAVEALTPTVTRTYDAAGHVATETGPLGHTTDFTHDQFGNPTSVTAPAPQDGAERPVTRYTYDLLGEQRSVTDPTGARTESTYDELGRRITVSVFERHPAEAVYTTRLRYDDSGNLVSTTSPGGAEASAEYNAAGQPVTETDAADGTTTYAYGPTGLLTALTDPLGRIARTQYDPAGRAVEVSDHDTEGAPLRSRSTAYDAEGNPVAVTDALGHTTRQTFDAAGRLTRLVEPVDDDTSVTTTFGYDATGQRTRLTDGRGHTTWYTHTSHGEPESVVEPATDAHPDAVDRTFTTVYDAAGRPVREIQPGGVTQQRTFDALGRITEHTGSGAEAATGTDTFTYDLADRLTSVNAPGGTQTFGYDDRGNLLTAEGPSGDASFTYDADGHLTSRTDAAGTTTFGYDPAGRLVSAAEPLTGATQGYSYNAASQPTGVTYGGDGAVRSYTYDDLGRLATDTLTEPGGATSASLAYAYDAEDRVTGKTTTGTAGSGAHTYTYDRSGRLTGWTAPDGTDTPYTWDAAGNRTTGGEATATYDERNRLLTADDTSYAYTARGTQRTVTDADGGTVTAAFDALGRMSSRDGVDYTYDGLGRLVQRGEDTPFAYADQSNNAVRTGDQLVTRDPAGDPLATADADGDGATAVLTDVHGDVTATFTPDDGTLSGSTAYSPFGQVAATDGATGALGYQGEYTDPETGEVNMHARWYDPASGGFTSRDSWTLDPVPSVQANRYTYGSASPLNHTDPTGHKSAHQGGGWAPLIGRPYSGGGRGSAPKPQGGGTPNRSNNNAGKGKKSSKKKPVTSHRSTSHRSQARRWQRELRYRDRMRGNNRPHRPTTNASRCTYNCGYSSGAGGASGGNGGAAATRVPQGPRGPQGPPPPPPPPPWHVILAAVISVVHARDVSTATVDSAQNTLADDSHTRSRGALEPEKPYTPELAGDLALRDLFPDAQIDPNLGYGWSGADPTKKRTRNRCERDLPSSNSSFYYAPMTRFGPGLDDCRATGAVGWITTFDIRPWRLDPTWKPAGYERLPKNNRAALHLIGNQLGGANGTLRNFVAGYQRPANSPDMSGLEARIRGAVEGDNQNVMYGVLPVYENDPAIPEEIRMRAVGDGGFWLDCTIYNRPSGGYDCSEG